MEKRNSPHFNPLVKAVTRTLSVSSIKSASLLKQVTYNLRLLSSHCLMFSMAMEDHLCLCPLMKCMTKWPLNSLKVETVFGVSLLNHTLVGPFNVIGKALHIISSGAPFKCMRVLNDSRWSSGSWPVVCFYLWHSKLHWEGEGYYLGSEWWVNTMDQLIQVCRYLSPHSIHHHVHLLLHHLHILGYAHCTDFYFRRTTSVFQAVPSAKDVALFLVFPLLPAPYR